MDPSTRISTIVGNSSNKNRTYFISGSDPNSGRVGSSDKYPYMFVNFGENTSEEDWVSYTPERGKIYLNISNDHSYRWTGSELLDLDKNWSTAIVGLSQNTIRTDTSQSFSASRLVQAFANLGMKVYVTDSNFLGSTLSAEEAEEVFVSKVLLFTDTGDLFFFGSQDKNRISFYQFTNNYYVGCVTIVKATYTVSAKVNYPYHDNEALRFTAQNPALTSAQQDVALSNIGLNFVHVDYSLLGTTLTDAQAQSIINSRGIILTNVPENFVRPTIYLKGFNDSSLCRFFALENTTTESYIDYTKLNKNLSSLTQVDLHFDSVRYSVAQTLSNIKKQQARTNIGVQSADELLEDADFIAQLKTKLGIE